MKNGVLAGIIIFGFWAFLAIVALGLNLLFWGGLVYVVLNLLQSFGVI